MTLLKTPPTHDEREEAVETGNYYHSATIYWLDETGGCSQNSSDEIAVGPKMNQPRACSLPQYLRSITRTIS